LNFLFFSIVWNVVDFLLNANSQQLTFSDESCNWMFEQELRRHFIELPSYFVPQTKGRQLSRSNLPTELLLIKFAVILVFRNVPLFSSKSF
jgi:hypothetical protein